MCKKAERKQMRANGSNRTTEQENKKRTREQDNKRAQVQGNKEYKQHTSLSSEFELDSASM